MSFFPCPYPQAVLEDMAEYISQIKKCDVHRWFGPTDENDRPVFEYDGEIYDAWKVMYEVHNGPIGPDQVVINTYDLDPADLDVPAIAYPYLIEDLTA